jgi:putative hemolysin
MGFGLPAGPYETLGGFVMARLGRLPTVGDEVRLDGWRLVVVELDGRRVARVAVAPVAFAQQPLPLARATTVETLAFQPPGTV